MPQARFRTTEHIRQQPRWLGLGTVRAFQLAESDTEFSNGHVTKQEPLLDGRINSMQVHPEIWLHAVEGCDLRTFDSSVPAQEGLHIVILLEGSIDVEFGPLTLKLPSNSSDLSASAQGVLVHTCQHETFVRHWRTGKFERKLSVRVNPALLQSLAGTAGYLHLQELIARHLSVQFWQPSTRAIVLAEQIFHLVAQESSLLLLQSRALEFVHEALQQWMPTDAGSTLQALPLRQHVRMARLKALIDAQQDKNVSVVELARDLGLSASALQRHFRQTYGTSIDDYRRTQRLERARAMLEQTGCSVLEAAHASGYTSAANFATAFKKRFGLTPKLLKTKI